MLDDGAWLQQPIIHLKGIGDKMQERFARRSLRTFNDLLFHLPIRYQDKTRVVPIASLRIGDSALIHGELVHCQRHSTMKRPMLSCDINDGSGVMSLRFFHFNHHQAKALSRATEQGKWLMGFGEVKRGRHSFEIIHPEYRIIEPQQVIMLEETLSPVYPTTEGLAQKILSNAIAQVLDLLQQRLRLPLSQVGNKSLSKQPLIADLLPVSIRQRLALPGTIEALFYLHQPPPDCPILALQEGSDPYRKALIFEELLAHQLTMKQAYQAKKHHHAYPMIRKDIQLMSKQDCTEKLQYSAQFLQQLPFKLTQAQDRVIAEIALDMSQAHPMQRLVQGDVGSGKTVVAAMAGLYAIESGFQVALMAPTELLAEQHRNNFQQWFSPLSLHVAWLSGKTRAKARREALQSIADGSAHIVIGTHALFQDDVLFQHLGLVIIDEQHRFGVHQRLSLLNKGLHNDNKTYDYYPHQLIMTATPIPRTLAMTAYADLDCSIIDELPPGRTPVETVVLGEQRRNAVLQRVYQACLAGRQAYWVCTLIEESELLQCQAAEKTYEQLYEQFPDLTIGLVHGRLKTEEKQRVMQAFKQGEIALLIATTVIEVGVDVPNASLMIIENAERLGLSQLHQLRGRVGRGSQSSACVLMYGGMLSKNAKARLMTLRETNDGFIVAQKDLALRGPGEVLGTKQTGLAEMKIADIMRDQALLAQVSNIAQELINEYPDSVEPIINRWIGQKMEYQNV
jgi:ATP-dependent DNA helicase RecG